MGWTDMVLIEIRDGMHFLSGALCCGLLFLPVFWLYLSSIRSALFQIRDDARKAGKP